MAETEPKERRFAYDVALSFAGEDRAYVEAEARQLSTLGLHVFYDMCERTTLWGKDLYEHLHRVYSKAARYCVLFVSTHYAQKAWATHERRSAQSRALQEKGEYILPARFDDTEIPGLAETVGYIDLRGMEPEAFARLVHEKVGMHEVGEFFPPVPDRLFDALGIGDDEKERNRVETVAQAFLSALRHMTIEERRAVGGVLAFGCPGGLPDYVHISLDLLRRCTGLAPETCLGLLGGVRALGVSIESREADDPELHEPLSPGDTDVRLHWFSGVDAEGGDATAIAMWMVRCAADHFCEEHGLEMVMHLDFVRLSEGYEGPVVFDD